jgi:hypothetical protein
LGSFAGVGAAGVPADCTAGGVPEAGSLGVGVDALAGGIPDGVFPPAPSDIADLHSMKRAKTQPLDERPSSPEHKLLICARQF